SCKAGLPPDTECIPATAQTRNHVRTRRAYTPPSGSLKLIPCVQGLRPAAITTDDVVELARPSGRCSVAPRAALHLEHHIVTRRRHALRSVTSEKGCLSCREPVRQKLP